MNEVKENKKEAENRERGHLEEATRFSMVQTIGKKSRRVIGNKCKETKKQRKK